MQPPRRQRSPLFPSPCTQGEGKGGGSGAFHSASWRLGGLIVFLSIFGCAAHSQPQSPPPHVISGDTAPPPVDPLAIHAEMYELQMPFGANSRDDSFWKLVDEDVLDVPTAQNLIRNGFRVGRARIADWPAFLKVLTNESAIKHSETTMMAHPSVDDGTIRMSDLLPEELLFIYDDHGLTMRSFSDCTNMLSLAFEWAPRKVAQFA